MKEVSALKKELDQGKATSFFNWISVQPKETWGICEKPQSEQVCEKLDIDTDPRSIECMRGLGKPGHKRQVIARFSSSKERDRLLKSATDGKLEGCYVSRDYFERTRNYRLSFHSFNTR